MNFNQCPVKNDKLAWRKVDNEGIILDTANDQAHILNKVAIEMWNLMDGTNSIQDISEHICKEYEVEMEQALKDTIEFAETLVEKGLIRLRIAD